VGGDPGGAPPARVLVGQACGAVVGLDEPFCPRVAKPGVVSGGDPAGATGPLLDASSAVIGINTAIASDSTGIGFSIPINIAKPLMAQALAGKQLERPYIGIRYEDIDAQLAKTDSLPVKVGALVSREADQNGNPPITAGSPAEAAGIQPGDIITAIGQTKIDTEHPLDAVLAQNAPGDTIQLSILRGGQPSTVDVTLAVRPSNP